MQLKLDLQAPRRWGGRQPGAGRPRALLHQKNHLHCIVEADTRSDLANGMKSFGARVAHAVNRVFGRRGAVLDGRYHSQRLTTPRQVRNALAYVLLNLRKHYAQCNRGKVPPVVLDEASSGAWFDGWTCEHDPPAWPREVAQPRTSLLSQGWRRHPLINPAEVPR